MTHWSLVISDETDRAVRAFLNESNNRQDDLSGFVEEAVRFRLFHLQIARIKNRNQQFNQAQILSTVDEAVDKYRAART